MRSNSSCFVFLLKANIFVKFLFFFISLSIVSVCSFGQINQSYQSPSCLDLQIEVLAEPFCQGSVNGGQLKVNVSPGSGSGDYSYEWLDDNGGYLPGGPQTNATTLSFLTVSQTYLAYVTDNITNCTDSISYIFEDYSCQEDTASLEVQSPFDINPVGYNQYSECDVKLVNLGCQLNFKPEFIISHESEDIELGDFIIEFYNAQSIWESISYSINTSGDAVGYWGSEGGETLNCDYSQVRPVRVKFNQFDPTAPTGEYTATLRLWSVDENGDPFSIVSEDAYVSLTLIDTICEDLSVNSQFIDASCSGVNDAQITLSGSGGQGPYLFSLSNSAYSTDSMFNLLTNGIYFAAIKDANGCQNSDTIFLGPEPVLPDSLWFSIVHPFSANIVWDVDSLVDGYKFRYREVGQAWQGPVASGSYSNGIAEMFPNKTLTGLTPATTYEVQVKANSLTGCEEGWSTEIYAFTTPMEVYVYNVDNTCVGTNSGQIEFEVISNNSYTFDWQGPNSFSSTDTSIYNLYEGNYNLQISNGQSIIFDSTFVVSVSDSDIGISLNGDSSLVSYSEQDGVYFAQACDLTSYIIADSGYSNYSWHYGDSLDYVQAQQILIDTSNVFIQVEALDSNNCSLTSDSIHISIISDYVNLINANGNEDYIDDVYVLCSADSTINIDISSFVTGGYSIEWREVIGTNSILLSEDPSIEITTDQSTAYTLNISSCSFDFYINYYPSPSIDVQHTNLLCYGDTDATIYIETDSSTSINYSLIDSIGNVVYFNNSIFPSDTIENVSAGVYTVELKDEFLCVVSQQIEILQPDSLYFDSLQIQNIECYGQGLGSISFKVYGGVDPDIFILNDDTIVLAQNQQEFYYIENLSAENYVLEVVDLNGCFSFLEFEIVESPEMLFSINSYADTISCYGDSTAFISLNSSGGTPSYIYDLYNSDSLYAQQSYSIFNDLPANTYEVFMSDSFGCKDSLTITIDQNPQLLMTENVDLHQDVLCDGTALGSITTIVQGGKMPYTVGLTGDTMYSYPHQFNNLYVGEYSFVVEDSEGCFSDTLISEIITNPASPELTIFSISHVDCQGLGSASFELTSGNEPFVFTLNSAFIPISLDEQNQFIINDLQENSFELIVKDNFLCVDTIDFEIFDNSEVDFEIFDIKDTLSCYMDSSGFVEFSVQNGTGPYIFDLVLDGDTIISQTSNYIDNLTIGDYVAHLTDAAGCQQQLNFSIITQEVIISDSLEYHKDISCYGASDGEFILHIESIYPSHLLRLTDTLNTIYPWYNHPHLFNNISGGIYRVEVATSEDDECPYFFEVEIIEPDPFVLDSILVTDVICNADSTGVLQAYFTGGTPDYTYLFNNDTSILANELYAGSYYLEISDSSGCTIDTNLTVYEPNELILSLVDSLTFNVSCFGNNNGQIGLDASGGVPPYQYSILGSSAQDTNVITELLADTFIVSVTDSVGCQDTLTVIISQPELNLFIDSYELSDSLGFCTLCYGDSTGFIDILLTGGSPAYNYFIVDEPDTFTSSHIEKLVGGQEYKFFAVDANGCLTDTITVECTSPDEIILDIEAATLPSCCYTCDSEVILLAEGGVTPYTYGFEDGAFQSDSLFNQLCGDSSYVFKILDSHGCEKYDSSILVENRPCLTVDTLNYVNNELPALIQYDICQSDGTAKIYTTAIEGVGSYSFSIDGEPFIQQDEIMFDSLFQGSHYIVVKDEFNCLDTLSFELDAPNPIVISELLIDTIFCGAPAINNMTNQSDIGSIHAIASGASSGVYFYSLDEIDSTLYQPIGLFDDLDSGYYSMNIVDLNDCVEEFDIYIPFYTASVEYSVSDITCPDFNNGIIDIDTIIGGFNTWVTLDGNTTTNNSFSSISEGEHNLTTHYYIPNSSELCSYTETIEFFDKEPLDFSYELKNPTCYGICDGSISVDQIGGGTSPYTILCLNTADTNLVFEDLCADEYAIKMIDFNGCFIIQDIMMTEPNAIYPIIQFEEGQLVVLEPTIGSPFSGTPPYSYQWYDSNGQVLGATDSLYVPTFPGVYSVVVTDDTNCTGESSLYKIEVLAMSNWNSDLVDVYPNPFKDVLKVSTDYKNEIDWLISDTRGRIIQLGQGTFSWTINTSELHNGIYFLRLKDGINELIYKIVKQ